MTRFQDGKIADVLLRPLAKHHDERGWLCELFRHDELPAELHPAMAYVSVTLPGVARGPHEHRDQSDLFGFIGPSTFKLYLWDARPTSGSFRVRQIEYAGIDRPLLVAIPPGIIHAYRNIGPEPGLVINAPNRLYRGPGKSEPVDEIRHEDVADSPYQLD